MRATRRWTRSSEPKLIEPGIYRKVNSILPVKPRLLLLALALALASVFWIGWAAAPTKTKTDVRLVSGQTKWCEPSRPLAIGPICGGWSMNTIPDWPTIDYAGSFAKSVGEKPSVGRPARYECDLRWRVYVVVCQPKGVVWTSGPLAKRWRPKRETPPSVVIDQGLQRAVCVQASGRFRGKPCCRTTDWRYCTTESKAILTAAGYADRLAANPTSRRPR